MAGSIELFSDEELQALVGPAGIEFVNLGGHNFFRHERVFIHAGLEIGERSLVSENGSALAGLETACQQEDSVGKATLQPLFVRLRELRGLASVGGEPEEDDEHDAQLFEWDRQTEGNASVIASGVSSCRPPPIIWLKTPGIDRVLMRAMLRPSLIRLFSLVLLSAVTRLHASEDYKPELFQSLKLVYEDTFDGSAINKEFWEVRQNTTWAIKDGVLSGGESSKEFQAKKKASADPSHAGLKPVIWLKKVPENFVCAMRVRYDAKAYQKGFPLLDLGHHTHTISFSEKATTLTIKKNVETLSVEKPLFALNQWHDVVIELKKGAILLKIDGVKHLFESKNIDMTGQAQIDFKAVDGGTCQIDNVKLWEGK